MNTATRFRALLNTLREAQWRVIRRRRGYIAYPPSGARPVTIHAHHRASDNRAWLNLLADLRRAGLNTAKRADGEQHPVKAEGASIAKRDERHPT